MRVDDRSAVMFMPVNILFPVFAGKVHQLRSVLRSISHGHGLQRERNEIYYLSSGYVSEEEKARERMRAMNAESRSWS
ncbi:MAG: hypothetical protein ABDH61_04635 [Acidilobaceae archaeon]